MSTTAQRTSSNVIASPLFLLILALFLSVLKIWLVSGQNFYAINGAAYDDFLYIRGAAQLLQGQWLGDFDYLTLIKGPFYPLWLASLAALKLPVFLSQHLLYLLACFFFVTAVRPLIKHPVILFILFTALLFNPMSFSEDFTTRIIREGIYPALTLLVLSGVVGVMVRYDGPIAKLSVWSIGLGLSLSAFWLTREEGVWIIPLTVLLIGITAVRHYRTGAAERTVKLIVCFLPLFILPAATLTVALINRTQYGIFSTSELKTSDFTDAYGALTRVRHARWDPMIPVPGETREKMYAVSPSFAELRNYLDGDRLGDWIAPGCRSLDICNDIAGGWFIWAFREAVSRAGYYHSGEISRQYYRRLAAEINAACDGNRLDCGPARSSLAPPWHAEYTRPLIITFGQALIRLAQFEGANASRTADPRQQVIITKSSDFLLTADHKIVLLDLIGTVYRFGAPALLLFSLIVYGISSITHFKKHAVTDLFIINSALIMTVCFRLFILSVIDVSSFPATHARYLSPLYPMVLIFGVLALWDGKKTLTKKAG